jgi:NAD(P)-dependent dehydrogenase (short-subunit alcohol dehydrogenase family)
MQLDGRRIVITGGSQGLGFAIAERCVSEGASVMICARDAAQLARAADALRQRAGEATGVTGAADAVTRDNTATASAVRVAADVADVTQPEAVARLCARANATIGGIDVLICNAGVNGAKGPADQVDWQEWMDTVSINLFGAVLCCRAVLPQFRAQRHGKIILLSGGGATNARPFFSAYAASKAALVRFGETLAEEVHADGIDVNAVAPGALNTRLLEDMLAAGPEKIGEAAYAQALTQQASGGTPLARGVDLCAFLASRASDGITGRLISAVWDPWADLPAHLDELRGSDIYTLRRILPEDRGKSWTPSA